MISAPLLESDSSPSSAAATRGDCRGTQRAREARRSGATEAGRSDTACYSNASAGAGSRYWVHSSHVFVHAPVRAPWLPHAAAERRTPLQAVPAASQTPPSPAPRRCPRRAARSSAPRVGGRGQAEQRQSRRAKRSTLPPRTRRQAEPSRPRAGPRPAPSARVWQAARCSQGQQWLQGLP